MMPEKSEAIISEIKQTNKKAADGIRVEIEKLKKEAEAK